MRGTLRARGRRDEFSGTKCRIYRSVYTRPLQAEGFRLYGAIGRVWAHQLGEEECALSFPVTLTITLTPTPTLTLTITLTLTLTLT